MRVHLETAPRTFFLFSFFCAAMAFCSEAPLDPIAAALDQGEVKTAYQRILSAEDGSEVASAFSRLSRRSAADPVLKTRMDEVALAFDRRLREEMNPLTFGTYLKLASDPDLDGKDRIRLILPMAEGASRLRAPQKDSLQAFLIAQLASAASPKMKAGLLALASRPSLAMDFRDIRSFCRFPEPFVREAAYQGLFRIVSRHRDRGEASANRTVFDSLKGDAAHPPDLLQVHVLAAIGEDYVRDHLAATCASDPAKLKAILTHDPYLKHVGLVKAALAIPADTPAGKSVRAALRYGLKESARVADRLAAGSPSDAALAAELRRTFEIHPPAAP
jgi:hypothetical protein